MGSQGHPSCHLLIISTPTSRDPGTCFYYRQSIELSLDLGFTSFVLSLLGLFESYPFAWLILDHLVAISWVLALAWSPVPVIPRLGSPGHALSSFFPMTVMACPYPLLPPVLLAWDSCPASTLTFRFPLHWSLPTGLCSQY